jgi:exopolyphosphatase/guanosine-5'-triphosphate,3'-diphosphate pyrophosphatase
MNAAETLTLIDIGSNAVRCLLVKLTPGEGFSILYQERTRTRLGGGQPGQLSQTAVEDTVTAIRGFLTRVRAEAPKGREPRVLAVATASVRDASNRGTLLDVLKQEEHLSVRVLSGEEEARLGALAALDRFAFRNGVVLDIGGGSCQIALVRAGAIHSTTSLPLGAVRATQQFFQNDPPSRQDVLALREAVQQRLSETLPPAREGKTLIGLGGTVRALASMQVATTPGARPPRQGLRLCRADIMRIRKQLENVPVSERRLLPGLKEERADIILAGAVLVEELMTLGDYDTLTVCKDGVRHGLLLEETVRAKGSA